MNLLDLFSGIGGFSLAAHWMGWQTVAFVEKEPFCHKVLNKNFQGVPIYDDIFTFDGRQFAGTVDIVCGGWPCQDNSNANQSASRQSGLDGERSGLFFEMARVLREVRPRYVVCENTPDVLTVNGGWDFNRILSELAAMGFNAEWGVLRASDFGAPHHRARLYMVAYAHGQRLQVLSHVRQNVYATIETRPRAFAGTVVEVGGAWAGMPDSFGVLHGIPQAVDERPGQSRARLKALGNSIVPQVAYEIFKAIEEAK